MAKRLAASGIAQCFVGLAGLVMASPATAQTTTLVCNMDPANPWKEEEPTTIELDEAQSSVVVHYGARTERAGGAHQPAYVFRPDRATFTSDTISWSNQYGDSFVINRLTGIYVVNFTSGGYWRWSCQAGKKQF